MTSRASRHRTDSTRATRPRPATLLVAVILGAIGTSIAAATAPTGWFQSVLGLVAFVLAAVCVSWSAVGFTIRRTTSVQVAGILLSLLLIMMVDGFALTLVHIRIDRTSTSLAVGVIAALGGGVAIWRARHAPIPAAATDPADPDPDPDTGRRRPRWAAAATLGLVLVILAAGAAVALVTNKRMTDRDAFIRLSTTITRHPGSDTRLLSVEVENRQEKYTAYFLTVAVGTTSPSRFMRVNVATNTTRHLAIRVAANADTLIRLYRVDRPTTLLRHLLIRSANTPGLSRATPSPTSSASPSESPSGSPSALPSASTSALPSASSSASPSATNR
jgi:hypothetical protein